MIAEPVLAGADRATPLSAPYWEALAQGRFVLQRCTACGRTQHYPRAVCAACGDDRSLEWSAASGAGMLVAAAENYRSSAPALVDRLPLLLGLVRWSEGPVSLVIVEGLVASSSDGGSGLQGRAVCIDHDLTRASGLLTVVAVPT